MCLCQYRSANSDDKIYRMDKYQQSFKLRKMNSNVLRKADFESIEKTKSLIIVHYKGRRLSIPLAQSCWNLTRFLNNQISNFEDSVLNNKQGKSLKTKQHNKACNERNFQEIVCFQQKTQLNSKNSIHLDLKMNIILNFIRDFTPIANKIPNNHQQQFYKVIKSWYPFPQFDITQIYKCIQIEPYFGENVIPMENKSQFGFNQIYKYKICSIMSRQKHKNIYLARRIVDGLFCVIKVIKDKKYLQQRNEYFDRFEQNKNPLLPNQIITYQSFVLQSTYLQNSFFTSVVQYCPGNNLEKYWESVNNKQPFEQAECFQFLKQLFKAAYFMHTCKGLMHRQISLSKIFVGFDKKLRINSENKMAIPIIFKTKGCANSFNYFQGQMPRGQLYSVGPSTPPQVRNSRDVKYNSLVDYYNIGLVVYKLLTGHEYNESVSSSRNSDDSESQICLKNVLKKILSDNLKQRGQIVSQILSAVIMEYQEKGMIDQLNEDQIISQKTIFVGEEIDQRQLAKSDLERQFAFDKNAQEKVMDREFSFLLQKKDEQQNAYLNPMNKAKSKKSRTNSKDKTKSDSKTKTKSNLQKTTESNSSLTSTKIRKSKPHDDKMSEASLDRSKHSRKSKKSKSHQKLSGESKQKPKNSYAVSKPIVSTESLKKLSSKEKTVSKQKPSQSKGKIGSSGKLHLNNNINQYNVNPRSIGNSPKNIRRGHIQGEVVSRNRVQQACKQRKQEILEYEYQKYYQRQY